MAKFFIGEHVASHNSGLVYVVKERVQLDLVGTLAYVVRRLRGGVEWGPRRTIGESGLVKLLNGDTDFNYDPDAMFPFATSGRTMTD